MTRRNVDVPQVHRGWPSMIQSASTLPRARRDWMPIELNRRRTNSLDVGRLTEQIAIVGRERLRSVEEQADAGVGEQRHAMVAAAITVRCVRKSAGKRIEAERLGYRPHAPRLGDRFEPTDQQLAGVLFEVAASVRIA
jgi:hypothetical protein